MKTQRGGFRTLRHEQLLQELVHDTYKTRLKLPEPTRRPDCGAGWHRGRMEFHYNKADNLLRASWAR